MSLLAILGWAYGGYKNPLDQIGMFFKSASQISAPAPVGIASYPWQWLINEVQIPYLVIRGNIIAGGKLIGSVTMVAFMGAMNPAILYLTIPSVAYTVYRYYRMRDDFSLFTLLWFAFTYLPYYPMSVILHRIMYIFYFLSTIPAVCLAISCGIYDLKTITKNTMWRLLIVLYLLLVLVGFYLFFPFKTIP
jgi:dolichyl-phosphate-mannose--protein O-mannosyl transferase